MESTNFSEAPKNEPLNELPQQNRHSESSPVIDPKIIKNSTLMGSKANPLNDRVQLEPNKNFSYKKVVEDKFRAIAKARGMSDEEITHHLDFIDQNYDEWRKQGKDFRIKKLGREKLSRTIEFIADTGTVVTHFKRKVGPTGSSKGQALGEGQFAVVKQSIINVSSKLEGTVWVADKNPKDKTPKGIENIKEEGKINQIFNNSENVTKCYRVNENGLLLEGMKCDLRTYLQENREDQKGALEIASEIINGVQQIHGKGYVHQDLHLGNIYISYDNVVKIGDFGSAQKIDELNNKPINLAISSSDIVRNRIFNINHTNYPRNDIWAIGIMLYELKYGRMPPFAAPDLCNSLNKAITNCDNSIKEIKKIENEDLQYLLMSWNGKEELKIPTSFMSQEESLKILANHYFQAKMISRKLYGIYNSMVCDFKRDIEDSTDEFEKLLKEILFWNSSSLESIGLTVKKLLTQGDDFKPAALNSEENQFEGSFTSDISKCSASVLLNEFWKQSSNISQNETKSATTSRYAEETFSGFIKEFQSENILQEALKKNFQEASEIFRKLLLNGCDVVGWRDFKGYSLLHLAINKKASLEFVKFLLELGSDPNVQNDFGDTSLHLAVKMDRKEEALLLWNNGANPGIENKIGETIIDLAVKSSLRFFDDNKLLGGLISSNQSPLYIEWLKNQAIMLELIQSSRNIDLSARRRLAFLCLHAYSKVAPLGPRAAHASKIQISPFFPNETRYHRSTDNEFIDGLKALIWKDNSVQHLIESPHFIEVFSRHFNPPRETFKITNDEDLKNLKEILEKKQNIKLVVDFTSYLTNNKTIKQNIELQEDSDVFEIKEALRSVDLMNESRICPVASCKWGSVNIFNNYSYIILNKEHLSTHKISDKTIEDMIRYSGYTPTPDQIKEAWLENAELSTILMEQALPESILATKGNNFWSGANNVDEFLNTKAFKDFKTLSEDYRIYSEKIENKGEDDKVTLSEGEEFKIKNPPYAKILSEGTVLMLEGLKDKNIEKAFKKAGLEDFMQVCFYNIIESIGSATNKVDDFSAFQRYIEVIHQQIQNILAIKSLYYGYSPSEFGEAAVANLTEGENPAIPPDLNPKAYIKASGSRCFASALASIEAEKGTNQLNVVVLKDSYYEYSNLFKYVGTYNLIPFDGEKYDMQFRGAPSINTNELLGFEKLPEASSIDVFLCEFHHNISTTRKEYHKENITEQIKRMHKEGILAPKCTVLLDTTIDYEKSSDLKEFLTDPTINQLIKEGKLNVVSHRSAQKFDQLGLDNYYGGIAITINKSDMFTKFNARMSNPDDQLTGLSYEGMTHLQKYSKNVGDKYRDVIMKNTKRIYEQLPEKMKITENNSNIAQVSKINDDKLVYLDFKSSITTFNSYLGQRLILMAAAHKIPFTNRASLGFSNMNSTNLNYSVMRLTPGLEGEKELSHYHQFFIELQNEIDESVKMNGFYFYDYQYQTLEDLKKQLENQEKQLQKLKVS
jgi:serine/threonine protein kinase